MGDAVGLTGVGELVADGGLMEVLKDGGRVADDENGVRGLLVAASEIGGGDEFVFGGEL